MKNESFRKLVSAEEAGEIVGLSPSTLRKLAWQGKIRNFKVLGALRFDQRDIESLIIERPAKDRVTACAVAK